MVASAESGPAPVGVAGRGSVLRVSRLAISVVVSVAGIVHLGGGSAWGAAQTYVVNSTADVANASTSSSTCSIAGSSTTCTLRAAIQASNNNNAGSGGNTIMLPPGFYQLTIPGP